MNVKKLISSIVYAVGGLLGLIFLSVNHLTAFASYKKETETEAITDGFGFIGYDFGKDIEGGFFKVLVAIALVGVIIASIVMLVAGVLKLLDVLGIDIKITHKSGFEFPVVSKISFITNIVAKISALVNMCACAVAFIFLWIFGICNISEYWGITIGMRPGVGSYLLLFVSIAVFAGVMILDSKKIAIATGPKYFCSACGKQAKATEKFCSACGGAVVQQVVEAAKPVEATRYCSACGKAAAAEEKFCASCGGAIVDKAAAPETTAEV